MKRKLGLFSYYGFNTLLKHRLQNIKTIGFDSTMLWWGDELAFSEMKPEEIVNECQKIDLEIENIHIPYAEANKIWSDNNLDREKLFHKYLNWLNECRKYNINMMVMHISEGYDIKKTNNIGIIFIKELVEIAEKYNIKIAIENIRNNNLLFEIFEKIDSKIVGLCFDSSHAWLYENKQNEILKRLGSKIFAVHFSDNDKKNDKHWLKYDGLNNWDKMLQVFPKELEHINISLEVVPKEDKNEIIFLEKAYKMAREIREKIEC